MTTSKLKQIIVTSVFVMCSTIVGLSRAANRCLILGGDQADASAVTDAVKKVMSVLDTLLVSVGGEVKRGHFGRSGGPIGATHGRVFLSKISKSKNCQRTALSVSSRPLKSCGVIAA